MLGWHVLLACLQFVLLVPSLAYLQLAARAGSLGRRRAFHEP